MGTIANLVVKFSADSASMHTELDSLNSKMGGFASSIAKVGAVAVAALGAGLTYVLKQGIDEMNDWQSATTQMNAVLASTKDKSGMTAKGLIDLAEGYQKTTKYSKDVTLGGEDMLMTFTNIGKGVFPMATAAMLNMSTAMGSSPKEAALQLGKALQDPTAGMTALQRVGVKFTDSQKAVITHLQKTGDMAGAQKIILGELNTEFGGSAVAAGTTFAGKLAIAENKLKDMAGAIAEKLMPYLLKFLDWVNANMPQIQAFFTTVFDGFKAAIAFLIPIISNLITWCIKYQAILIPIAVGLGVAAAAFVVISGAIAIASAASAFFAITMFAAAIPLWAILAVIALLAAAVYLVISHWAQIGVFFSNLYAGIMAECAKISPWFQKVFNEAWAWVVGIWNGAGAWFGSIAKGIMGFFAGIGAWFGGIFRGAWSAIVGVWSAVTGWFSNIVSGIQTSFSSVGSKIIAGFKAGIDYIIALPGKCLTWGGDMIRNFASGITGACAGVLKAAQGVANGIKAIFGHSAPTQGDLVGDDKWMPDMMLKFANGIKNNKGLVTSALNGLSTDMSVGMNMAVPSMGGSGGLGSTGSRGYQTANIIVQIDGQTLTKVIGQKLVDQIRLKTGIK